MLKVNDLISVYDGDLVGWTTATLIEKVGEIDTYERWRMITKEGYELRRLLLKETETLLDECTITVLEEDEVELDVWYR